MQSGTNKLKAPVSTVIDEAAGLALWLPVSRRLLQVGRAAPDQAPVTPVALPPTLPASELQGEHMGGRTLGEAGESPLGAATPGHPGPPPLHVSPAPQPLCPEACVGRTWVSLSCDVRPL